MLENKERASVPTKQRKWRIVIKRLLDLLLGILLLVLLSPLFLYIVILIFNKEGKPVFHRECCTDRENRPFTMWRFRTLSNPSRVITALPPYPYPEPSKSGNLHADNCIIITATGRWLKKYQLDKLPLLFNIIRGDISFVRSSMLKDCK